MKINITKELEKNSLVSHIILHGISHSINKNWPSEVAEKGKTADGVICDLIVTVNGDELNIEHFIKHWQDQVENIIKKEAKDLMKEKFYKISDLFNDLENRLEEEIDKRLEDWEKEK